ncbi:hypothetical protein LX81_01639 [Palleronia aestuarii]|uniref:Phytase-like domain-containing protein n=1 Tax=Palleronia aestuarii TaxID=568105 RepID=A0A2W7Q5L4_9RHOB|nr:esterase-like activity of phytase family protein [Palleronia aestuarii]PZX17009.1 hypothetical protein LX81_01639 [Palleronia aestuarii]
MTRQLLAILLTAGTAVPAAAQQEFPATLTAWAALPAATFTAPPEDAPAHHARSGRFTGEGRTEELGAIRIEETGVTLPMEGQPVQGFSGIRSLGEDRFLVLTDNGFGTKANSADVLLMFHEVEVDWENAKVGQPETTFLSDPLRRVPFPIVNEATETRYLTGADFDLESIQPIGDGYWIGDEFGPWLIEVDGSGVVQQVVPTEVGGQTYLSPDNPAAATPNSGEPMPEELMAMRSGGYEGMALGPDGTTLYPLLEKPVWDAAAGAPMQIGGTPVLSLFEFDTTGGGFAEEVCYYPLDDAGHAIGDFNMIDETRALVIERDGGQGTADFSDNPAEFKRIYLVDLDRTDEAGVLEKIAYIDLMDIRDPDGIGRGTTDGVFTFPFVTIEDVDRVDATTIVVANDNNYPFSVGREAGRADDNEFILLDVADFLSAE